MTTDDIEAGPLTLSAQANATSANGTLTPVVKSIALTPAPQPKLTAVINEQDCIKPTKAGEQALMHRLSLVLTACSVHAKHS